MNKFTIYAYSIECLTSLHVGSGGDNFGIVDKEIQRDQVNNVPIIHASSLKGALREFFEKSLQANPSLIKTYFGSDKSEQSNLQQGMLRFFEARLFSLPIRGAGNVSSYLATSRELVDDFNRIARNMGASASVKLPEQTTKQAITEFGDFALIDNAQNIGDSIALLDATAMNKALKDLPIIARNSLENGQSENLWYEEVIPRNSKFFFFIAAPESSADYETNFENPLLNSIVQIGANATIGYGFCKISKLV
ncbi:RAMP superfamily protein [anaerobic digester metagenome]